MLVYRLDYSGLSHTKESSDAYDHPAPLVRGVEVATFDSPYGASEGTHHAPGYALGNGDKHLTSARWHDAAYYETT